MNEHLTHGHLRAVENAWPRRLHTLDDYATAGVGYTPEPRVQREPLWLIVYGMGMLCAGAFAGAALTLMIGGFLQ